MAEVLTNLDVALISKQTSIPNHHLKHTQGVSQLYLNKQNLGLAKRLYTLGNTFQQTSFP